MDISDIIFFFSVRAREGGSGSDAPGRGGGGFIENPRGGVSRAGGGLGVRLGGCLRGIGGVWGAKYFFSGPKFPPRISAVVWLLFFCVAITHKIITEPNFIILNQFRSFWNYQTELFLGLISLGNH